MLVIIEDCNLHCLPRLRWSIPQTCGFEHSGSAGCRGCQERSSTDTPYAGSSMLKSSAKDHRQTSVDRR
jgi:hypothetical protein